MTKLQSVLDCVDQNLEQAIERLFDLVRIKSISTDPEFTGDCNAAAEWLVNDLKSIGFEARVCKTEGHPMVVAHHDGPKNAPHALFYGHYDVQPVDPIDLWDEPPFEPSITKRENGSSQLNGRGTSDDKGQLMTFLEACRAWKSVNNSLPLKITILFEGEEESGSPSLIPFLNAFKDELKADFAMVCDTGMWDEETPRHMHRFTRFAW